MRKINEDYFWLRVKSKLYEIHIHKLKRNIYKINNLNKIRARLLIVKGYNYI